MLLHYVLCLPVLSLWFLMPESMSKLLPHCFSLEFQSTVAKCCLLDNLVLLENQTIIRACVHSKIVSLQMLFCASNVIGWWACQPADHGHCISQQRTALLWGIRKKKKKNRKILRRQETRENWTVWKLGQGFEKTEPLVKAWLLACMPIWIFSTS